MVAEETGDGLGFIEVIEMRGRTVGIDIVYIVRSKAGILDGESHAFGLLDAFRSRSRNMIGVGIAAIAANFTVNMSTPFFSVFQFFQEYDAGSFAHDETIAVFIEGAGSVCRVIIAGTESLHGRKTSYGTGGYGSFRATGYGCVEFAALDHAVCRADGIRPRCTGGDDAGAMALETEDDGYLARCHIANHLGYDERVDP